MRGRQEHLFVGTPSKALQRASARDLEARRNCSCVLGFGDRVWSTLGHVRRAHCLLHSQLASRVWSATLGLLFQGLDVPCLLLGCDSHSTRTIGPFPLQSFSFLSVLGSFGNVSVGWIAPSDGILLSPLRHGSETPGQVRTRPLDRHAADHAPGSRFPSFTASQISFRWLPSFHRGPFCCEWAALTSQPGIHCRVFPRKARACCNPHLSTSVRAPPT